MSPVHKNSVWTRSKAALGALSNIPRARVCNLQNPNPDGPIAPHHRALPLLTCRMFFCELSLCQTNNQSLICSFYIWANFRKAWGTAAWPRRLSTLADAASWRGCWWCRFALGRPYPVKAFSVSSVTCQYEHFFLRAGSPSGAKQSGNYCRVQRAIQPNIITLALWSQMNTTQLCSEHSKSKQLPWSWGTLALLKECCGHLWQLKFCWFALICLVPFRSGGTIARRPAQLPDQRRVLNSQPQRWRCSLLMMTLKQQGLWNDFLNECSYYNTCKSLVVLYVITIIIIYCCGLRLNASGSQNQCWTSTCRMRSMQRFFTRFQVIWIHPLALQRWKQLRPLPLQKVWNTVLLLAHIALQNGMVKLHLLVALWFALPFPLQSLIQPTRPLDYDNFE